MIQRVTSSENVILPLDAFIRSIGINRNTAHSLFLGAGSSTSSGIPSAELCIWEWKRNIFLTNNPGLESQFSELSLPAVQQKIQAWLDKQGRFPALGSQEEYGFYIGTCFPISNDRRIFFQEKTRQAQPHVGYQLLAHMALENIFQSAWSTNFDGLPARAAGSVSLAPVEVGIDSTVRLIRQPRKGELLCVSLHGDYRYDELKNTETELQSQDADLRKGLIKHLESNPTIVVGYSGRDTSIMEAFSEAYAKEGTGVLYWCGYGDGPIPHVVDDLLQLARSHGRRAYYVPTQGFDDLMVRLAQHCLAGQHMEAAKAIISSEAERNQHKTTPFVVEATPYVKIIKSNAFGIDCPAEVLQFDPIALPKQKPWEWIGEKIRGHKVAAVPSKGKILALGTVDAVKEAFAGEIKGSIERTPVVAAELRYDNGAMVSLMRSSLARSFADSCGLATDGRREIWLADTETKVLEGGVQYLTYQSASLSLRNIGRRLYLIIKPSIKVLDIQGREVSHELSGPVKMRILSGQYNKLFNQAVMRWRKRLFDPSSPRTTFEFPANAGSTFRFQIDRSPIFSEIAVQASGVVPPDSLKPLIRHTGFELKEPKLLFSSRDGSGIQHDIHPIRGLLVNRPFDYSLSERRLAAEVKLGVICPQTEAARLHQFLQKVHQGHAPNEKERDYLQDYPGFAGAYGLPIEVPAPGTPGWVTCPEPTARDAEAASVELGKLMTRAIDTLQATQAPNVILLYFPKKWDPLQGYKKEGEHFDLHDFVKAYGVQRGVATQFLQEKTLVSATQCRIWWWLSLALYVKSMRTPWLIDSLDSDTAYVGLGFSLDTTGAKGKHVLLGCSHIYSARGEGLQYRLSKVEDFEIRRGNPFMSREDARRLGESIRQLFYESKLKIPGRVVVHKKTEFRRDEREGLLDGLKGVSNIEMIEIQEEHALRYVSSVPTRNGGLDEDNYPVRRGTVVKLDDFSALAWVHGAAMVATSGRIYYQGKRRIPAPLIIRRHCGKSDLRQITEEIMGLSKMNWNSFDLYSRAPATIHSSNEIARIGSLLNRFGGRAYDYRLFM